MKEKVKEKSSHWSSAGVHVHVALALPRPLQPVGGKLTGQLTLGLAHVLAADRPAGIVQVQGEAVHHRPAFIMSNALRITGASFPRACKGLQVNSP